MNSHPVFVHFPIGILVLYAVFEIARIKIITRQPWYFELKAVLSIIGTLAAYVTATTGELAEEIIENIAPDTMALVETHSMYAVITIVLFSILAASYLFEWLKKTHTLTALTRLPLFGVLSTFIQRSAPLIAFAGLCTITITGGLGAAIVYGPQTDPFVAIIYNTFASF